MCVLHCTICGKSSCRSYDVTWALLNNMAPVNGRQRDRLYLLSGIRTLPIVARQLRLEIPAGDIY